MPSIQTYMHCVMLSGCFRARYLRRGDRIDLKSAYRPVVKTKQGKLPGSLFQKDQNCFIVMAESRTILQKLRSVIQIRCSYLKISPVQDSLVGRSVEVHRGVGVGGLKGKIIMIFEWASSNRNWQLGESDCSKDSI